MTTIHELPSQNGPETPVLIRGHKRHAIDLGRRNVPLLEDVTPATARAYPDIFSTLTEAIKIAGIKQKPRQVFPALTEAGIRVKKVEVTSHARSRGKYTNFDRFFILREDLPQATEFLKDIPRAQRIRRIKGLVLSWAGLKGDLSITRIAKELHMNKDTVRKLMAQISSSDPDFPVLPKRVELKIESVTIENVTRSVAQNHTDKYSSLGDTILEANVFITSRRAAAFLQEAGLRIRILPEGLTARFFIPTKDKAKAVEILSSRPLIDAVSGRTLRDHPELYSPLKGLIKDSGTQITPRDLAELLTNLNIRVRHLSNGSESRYFIMASEKEKVLALLRGLIKDLLKPSNRS